MSWLLFLGRDDIDDTRNDNQTTGNDLAVVCSAPAMRFLHALGVLAALAGTAWADDEPSLTVSTPNKPSSTPKPTPSGPATIMITVGGPVSLSERCWGSSYIPMADDLAGWTRV